MAIKQQYKMGDTVCDRISHFYLEFLLCKEGTNQAFSCT